MNDHLRADIQAYPHAFWLQNPLSGSVAKSAIELWHPPSDLVAFWTEFGTGDLFESEVILRPFQESPSIPFITKREQAKGFPENLTVFHYGVFVSGFNSAHYEAFDGVTLESLGRYQTLDEWYVHLIRDMWGKRYGLPVDTR